MLRLLPLAAQEANNILGKQLAGAQWLLEDWGGTSVIDNQQKQQRQKQVAIAILNLLPLSCVNF